MPVWIFEYQLYNTNEFILISLVCFLNMYTQNAITFTEMGFKLCYTHCFFFLFACLGQTIKRKIKQQKLVNIVYII